MRDIEINSPTNERIKRLVRLRDRDHRKEEGMFLVEGDRLFERARASGLVPVEIYITPGHPLEDEPGSIIVKESVLTKASYRNRSEGVIAVFAQFSTHLVDIEMGPTPFVLIAESLEKPGNLGAILRTADAAGCTAVLTTGAGADLFNPNTIRTSTGAAFAVPYAHTDLTDLAAYIGEHQIKLVAASPEGESTMWDSDLTGPLAILVGAEHTGVSDEALRLADRSVVIPMSGTSDSLNVSVSAAVLIFEALRQRSIESG